MKHAFPADATGLPGPEYSVHVIPIGKLREMDTRGLVSICDAMNTLNDVISGFLCQPRFNKDGNPKNIHNEAGRLLDDFLQFIQFYGDTAGEFLRRQKPTDENDAEARAWAILKGEASIGENLTDYAILVAEVTRDVATTQKFARAK